MYFYSPNMDIRKKTLDFAMDLVSPRNIDEVISVLKKEINRTQSTEEDQGGEYRQVLIQGIEFIVIGEVTSSLHFFQKAIHGCAVRFPAVASNVVHVLMDFLGDSNAASALDVILFVRYVATSRIENAKWLLNLFVQKRGD